MIYRVDCTSSHIDANELFA